VPGIRWVLAFTTAAEISDIGRFARPEKLTGYTGLCPRVVQSGDKDRRRPLSKHGPTYLCWALLEATMHTLRHPAYTALYQRTERGLTSSAGRGRPSGHRPPARPRDLAYAHSKRGIRSTRRRLSSGGLTALFGHAPASERSDFGCGVR
jgi:hypothetical protein